MADSLFSHPDLPSFQVVPPRDDLKLDDFKLADGTPMRGPDGQLIPEARSFTAVYNAAQRIYSYRFDEAMYNNQVNARAMRRDAFILGLLEERILPTINRKWQIEVPDAADVNQRYVQDEMTKLIDAIPDFDAYKRALLDGVWFGRAAVQQCYARNPLVGNRWTVPKWDPVHGDSVQFTFDGVPAILMDTMTAGWYAARGATRGPWGDVRATDRGGMALVLQNPYWRDRFVVHQHIRQKADYFEGVLAGSVQGLGLRGQVYWQYVVRTDALTWMLAYMQSVGQMDMLIFNYPTGDHAAKLQQQQNANKIIGKAAFICPRPANGNWPAVEQLSMNDSGLKALHDLVAEYFDRHIERLIVGQSMSAGFGGPGGLEGDGRADFARATKDEILIYDTNRLDNVLTRDLIAPLMKYNFKWAKFGVKFKSVLPNLEGPQKVEAGSQLIMNGISVKVDEMREAAGFSKPDEGDEIIGGLPPMMPGMDPNGMPPDQGGPPMLGPGMPAGPSDAAPAGPPMQFSGGSDQPPPTEYEGGSPTATPAMGYPGGGNTYLPGFSGGKKLARREPDDAVGFTRYATPTKAEVMANPDLSDAAKTALMRKKLATNRKAQAGYRTRQSSADPAAIAARIGQKVTGLGRPARSGELQRLLNLTADALRAAQAAGDGQHFRTEQRPAHDNGAGRTATWFYPPEQYARPSAPVYYKDGPHKFCTTQVDLSGEAAIRIRGLGKMLPPGVLAADGVEDTPHVTLLYGLHDGTAEGVKRILAESGPIRMKLGKVSVFPGPEGKDYDVLKVDVESSDLRRLHHRLKALPNSDKWPTYKPHATIAYVKKGLGEKLAAGMKPLNLTFTADEVAFCGRDGTPVVIKTAEPVKYAKRK